MTCRRWLASAVGMAACLVVGVGAAVGAEPRPVAATAPIAVAVPADLPPAPVPVPLAPDSVEARLEILMAAPTLASSERKADRDDLTAARTFYGPRRYAPLWIDDRGLSARAQLVLAEIGRADDWGLKSADFKQPVKPTQITRDTLADLELAVTRAVLKYARHARGGRIADPTQELSEFIDRKPQLIAGATILEQIAAAPAPDTYLTGLHPQHAQFQRLRFAYLKLRSLQAQLATLRLPEGPAIYPGQSHPHVAILRKRLGVAVPTVVVPPTGAPAQDALIPAEIYDPALVTAVKVFQTEAGKRPDGIVGDKTRAALNADGEGKTGAILANMEQWRWMPTELGATHVMVNIPQFQMQLVRNGVAVHTERVVTGKAETPTPVFSEQMQTVVFQPKWGVPDSIKINELLPRLQDGRGLKSGLKMALGGREINPWSVDWSRADITRYQVYQPSGDDNALGVVKFLFPNKHAVYLHDTPAKGLFNAEARAYSHGCVRLRNPVRLAELVLGADKGWTSARVRDLVEDGPEDNAVKLDGKIPVHITYFTAVVDDAGRVQTFGDIYDHEDKISRAIGVSGSTDRIAKASPVVPATAPRAVTEASRSQPSFVPDRPRRTAERYSAPAGLGYVPAPKFFAPPTYSPPKAASSGTRYRGNTTNDIIMRQLGAY